MTIFLRWLLEIHTRLFIIIDPHSIIRLKVIKTENEKQHVKSINSFFSSLFGLPFLVLWIFVSFRSLFVFCREPFLLKKKQNNKKDNENHIWREWSVFLTPIFRFFFFRFLHLMAHSYRAILAILHKTNDEKQQHLIKRVNWSCLQWNYTTETKQKRKRE